MTEEPGEYGIENLTYEQKVEKLDELLTRLDNSETPIDKLAEDVKLGARLIKDLDKKLKEVETEVRDAFKKLCGGTPFTSLYLHECPNMLLIFCAEKSQDRCAGC